MLLRPLAALASLLLADAVAPAAPAGPWLVNGARLELTVDGTRVLGTLAAEGGPCRLPVGTQVLHGTLLDDSLSAQVALCVVSDACASEQGEALAVLLVTRTLTGGVHSKAACAKDVHALVLRRPGAAQAMSPPPRLEERLSQTPPPSPRAAPDATVTPVGEIAGRPVGDPRHPAGYDPRDARRKGGTPEAAATRLLAQGARELKDGQFERARASFHAAAEQDPQRAEAWSGVGVTHYARGDYDEALAWYKRALEADPRFGDAYYNMACIYALSNRRELAFRYLRLAALNHYAEREQTEADSDLASLHGDPQWDPTLELLQPKAGATAR